MLRSVLRVVAGLGMACWLVSAAHAQAPQAGAYTPVQLAYIKAETKKANDQFVKDVAKIAGTTEAQVKRALPDEKRITDRTARLIDALEQVIKSPLTDEQKAAIQQAEDARRKALAEATESARSK